MRLSAGGRSAQYKTCPFCGDHLDFGEKCDCQGQREVPPDTQLQPPAKKETAPDGASIRDGRPEGQT